MGVVYLAEDTVLGRRVAIETLKEWYSPEFSRFKTRFLREARLASTLNHPHIVSVFDYGEADGHPYLMMEFVKGRNLADVLRADQLPLDDIVRIVRQIAQALAEAHAHGIVHRDLKPSNIFLNERRDVKVLDFGLAKLFDADIYNSRSYSAANSELFTQTREGVFLGTPSYSSPEQLLGNKIDGRSDIFWLGAVLYECLAGQPAFSGKNFAEICAQVIKDDPLPPSKLNPAIPAGFDAVALKALSKRAENRHQTIQELIRDLETAPAAGPTEQMNPAVENAKIAMSETSQKAVALQDFSRLKIASIATSSSVAFAAIGFALTCGFQRYFASSANTAPPAYAEGVAALRNGNFYKAAKLLETAVQQNERFPLAHARLAEALGEPGFGRSREA